MTKSFNSLPLSTEVLSAIEKKGYETPTEIQERVITTFFEHTRDIYVQSQTGTGKTGAYGLPILSALSTDKGPVTTLVLTPTRELTLQVSKELTEFNSQRQSHVCPILGGESMERQLKQLKRSPQLVVGSPGRIIDHMKRGSLDVSGISYLVLDEADEMLNKGFIEDIEFILSKTPKQKRTILVSATFDKPLKDLANRYMQDPVTIESSSRSKTVTNVEQLFYEVEESEKVNALCRVFDSLSNLYCIVFCKTKRDVDVVAQELINRGYSAEGLHGDLSQPQRNRVLSSFKNKKSTILVATDVAARGIDINNLTHVFNLSLPQDNESYVHRIGRTGRAGKKGTAITIISPREFYRLNRLQKMLKVTIEKKRIPNEKQVLQAKLNHLAESILAQKASLDDSNLINAYETLIKELSEKEIIFKCLAKNLDKSLLRSDRYPVRDLFDKQHNHGPSNKNRSSRRPFQRNRSGQRNQSSNRRKRY